MSFLSGLRAAVVTRGCLAALVWSTMPGPVLSDAQEADDEPDPLVQIPERDEAQIAQARTLKLTREKMPAEVARIAAAVREAMDPAAREEALRLVAKFRGQGAALANAAAIAWVQRSPEQALLLGAEAAEASPADANALNTLSALLTQAGYEGKSIPLLNYLAELHPDDPAILGNLGVAWLNLGEVEEAKRILARCLARSAGHGTANLAAGIIAEHEGRKAEAVAHFKRASESNSSPQARRVLRALRETPRPPKGFFGMMPRPEYFSPGAFEPVRPQKLLAEHDTKRAEKLGYEQALRALMAAQEKEFQQEMAGLLATVMSGRSGRPNPYAKLDWSGHIKSLDEEGRLKRAQDRLVVRMQAIYQLREQLNHTRTPGVPESPVPECERRRPVAQAALDKMVVEYEKAVDETLFIWRDVTNSRLGYLPFTTTAETYRASYFGSVTAYLGFVRTLNELMPLVPDPCAGRENDTHAKFELVAPGARDCPFSIDIDAMVATLHMDCHSFGFDFQAGLAFSATKDFTSGETTLTAGVGAKMDLESVGSAGVSGQMVIVWDAGNDLSFVGVEANAGAKLSGIPGLAGTLAGDTFDLGREPGAPSDGPSVTATGADLTKDLVKVGSTTRLGMEVGPRGCDPHLSGEISGQLLGREIFGVRMP